MGIIIITMSSREKRGVRERVPFSCDGLTLIIIGVTIAAADGEKVQKGPPAVSIRKKEE